MDSATVLKLHRSDKVPDFLQIELIPCGPTSPFEEPGGRCGPPVAGDGKVYAATDRGTVVVIKAGRRFDVLARNDLGEPILATLAIVDVTALYAKHMAPVADIALKGRRIKLAVSSITGRRFEVADNAINILSVGYGEVIVLDLQ